MTKPNLNPKMTSAGPVTVKRADGSEYVLPAYKVQDGKRVNIPAAVGAKVWKRDGKRCRYCGSTKGPFRLDQCRPGKVNQHTIVVACLPCITRKGDATWTPRVRSKYARSK